MLWDFSYDTWTLMVQHMSVKRLLRLPDALVAARRAQGMLQKSAAASVGLCQTVLSAMETGRRTPEKLALLAELAKVYELGEEQTHELLLAASHDQLMSSVRGSPFEPAAELISKAALLHTRLSEDEIAGVIADLQELIDSKARIRALVHRGRPAQPPAEGRHDM